MTGMLEYVDENAEAAGRVWSTGCVYKGLGFSVAEDSTCSMSYGFDA